MATLLSRALRRARAIQLVASSSSFSRPLPSATLRTATWKRTLATLAASSSSNDSSAPQQQRHSSYNSSRREPWQYSSIVAGAALAAAAGYLVYRRQAQADSSAAHAAGAASSPTIVPGQELPSLPYYSKDDVTRHTSREAGGIWVVYKSGVYDITQFVDEHPGGSERIMMAAGGSIEPYWMLYAVHNNPEVWEVLESKRIGNLRAEDREFFSVKVPEAGEGPYANDPSRHPALIVLSNTPFNAEPPRALLGSSFITPTAVFFTRNHLPVPDVDPSTYSLEISIEAADGSTKRLSLEDLKTKFQQHTITATLQCAGNRREELMQHKPIKGLAWDVGAISTAEWRGVRLSDVLAYCGVTNDTAAANKLQHIQFEGLDHDATTCYGASIPISVALNPNRDVLLAFEMNGEPLTRDHGFPVRAIVPGTVAARNVKWLGRIIASPNESQNHWQQRDYKSFSPEIDWHNVEWRSAPAIQEMPLQSAITSPGPNTKLAAKQGTSEIEITVRGYAWSGGGRNIARVDVSADDGLSWHTAELNPDAGANQPYNKAWAWTLWESTFVLPPAVAAAVAAKGETEVSLLCRAVDASYNSQPERGESIWNLRGVVNNAWHRVPIRVVASE